MQVEMPKCEAPGRLATLLEIRAPIDWASLVFRAPQLASAPRGDGRPVMLIPGYGAGESSMRPLGRYLNYLGYDVYDWGHGRNLGKVEQDIRRVGERARKIHDERGDCPVTLIGWSLGGVSAREAARLYERFVREVITLGTPIIGGPKYTLVAKHFAREADIDLDALEQDVHKRNLLGIRQPVMSIYSKTDGIVGWRACVDVYNAHARNVEVTSSHFGLGGSGRVWQLIARRLAGAD